MNELKVTRGASADWTLAAKLRSDGGTPTGYTDSIVLTARVWPGGDLGVVLEPAAEWVDAAACKFKVSVVDADTADVLPGRYELLVTASVDGRTVALARAAFVVVAGPPTAEVDAPKVYCTAEDLDDLCPWIGLQQLSGKDRAGFVRQRAKAREWLDGLVLAGYTGSGYSVRWEGMPTAGGVPLLANRYMQDLLDGDALVLTGPRGRKAVEACACYALGLILRGSSDAEQRRLGATFTRSANAKVSTLIVELDADGDGRGELAVALCTTNTLRG